MAAFFANRVKSIIVGVDTWVPSGKWQVLRSKYVSSKVVVVAVDEKRNWLDGRGPCRAARKPLQT